MKTSLVAGLCGLLFGVGLTVSGMASTQNVLGFLTFGPGWNPALIGVMGGALAVALPGFYVLRRRTQPWFAAEFDRPGGRIDRRLLAGAAIFGIGWGLVGYCPGPVLVGLSLLQSAAFVFLPAMLLGAALAKRI